MRISLVKEFGHILPDLLTILGAQELHTPRGCIISRVLFWLGYLGIRERHPQRRFVHSWKAPSRGVREIRIRFDLERDVC